MNIAKSFKEKTWVQITVILIVSYVLWVLFSLALPERFITDSLKNDIQDRSTIVFIYYFFALYLSALLASIAYFNLSRLNKEVKAKFLLDIDKRWGESQIIDAREKIHQFYLECRDPIGQKNKETEKIEISNKILELSRDKSSCAIKSYIRILNFLDFMETIGYLFVSEDVTVEQLNELCGQALVYNFEIFLPLIKRKRSEHRDDKLYENFEKLYIGLRAKKLNLKVETQT